MQAVRKAHGFEQEEIRIQKKMDVSLRTFRNSSLTSHTRPLNDSRPVSTPLSIRTSLLRPRFCSKIGNLTT